MADVIPLVPSQANYRIEVPLDDARYIFDVRWNPYESAWYFDMYEEDETPIVVGVKIVLGMYLARRCRHAFFATNALVARDTSQSGVDAGFDDMGTRVQLIRFLDQEIMGGRGVEL